MAADEERRLTAKEKIDILFKEYDTLRAEANIRIAGTFQWLGIGILAVTWTLSEWNKDTFHPHAWPVVGGLTLIFSLFAAVLSRDTKRVSARIREIENHINTLAHADLLCWESRWGALATGVILRSKTLPRHGRSPQ